MLRVSRFDSRILFCSSPSPKGIAAMSSSTTDCAPFASRLWFKQRRVQVGKVLQLQSRNFLTDEMFDGLQSGNFVTTHQRERVADILRPAGPSDPVHIIFGV